VGVCVEYPSYTDKASLQHHIITFQDSTEDDRFLVNYNKESIFNFDYDNKITYYAVQVSDNSIMFDSEYGKNNDIIDQCVLTTDGKVVDRFVDFCSDASSGNYYTCKYGKCESRFYKTYDDINTNGNLGKFLLRYLEI